MRPLLTALVLALVAPVAAHYGELGAQPADIPADLLPPDFRA